MALPFLARLGTPIGRTSVFYFMLFLTNAVATPYLGIWLSEKGISPEQIGIINAVPFLLIVLLGQIVGRIADRAGDWRSTIVIGSVLATVGPVLLLFVDDYVGILIVWTILTVPLQLIVPVLDAASIRLARRHGADFAMMRFWGTTGFIIVTVMVGVVLERFGPETFVPMIIIAGILRMLFSFQLPLFKAPTAETTAKVAPARQPNPLVANRLSEAWRPWFLLPLIGAALVHGSHMMQLGWGALLWAQSGVPPSLIGPVWALGQVGELAAMLVFARLARRFSARHLLLVGSLVAAARWTGFALAPPLWGIAFLQLGNFFSFGLTYMGIVNFIANFTTERIAAEAQGLYNVFRQTSTIGVLFGFGFLTAQFGFGAYYGAAIMCVVGAALIFVSLLLMHPRHERAK